MANRIKEIRKEKGMTLLEIANKLGVSESTVQRYESGNIKNLKYETMVFLSEIFGCSPAYLMGWDDNIQIQATPPLRPDESSLLEDYNQLSDVGQHKVCSYTKKLLDVEQAENLVNAAHSRTDIDVTDEMMIHDEEIMGGDDF